MTDHSDYRAGADENYRVLRPVREISAEEENFRTVPFVGDRMFTTRRDPVEPEPVGTYVVMVFQVEGYDPDCDGSLMARLKHVTKEGEPTGWEPTHLGLHPDTDLVVEHPSVLWDLQHVGWRYRVPGGSWSHWSDTTPPSVGPGWSLEPLYAAQEVDRG